MTARDVDVVSGDPVVEAVVVDVLLDCFTGISEAALVAINALGCADGDPSLSTTRVSLQSVVGTLSECRCYCEQMSTVMKSLLCAGEGSVLSPANTVAIEVVEGVVHDLVDAGGLRATFGDSRRNDG